MDLVTIRYVNLWKTEDLFHHKLTMSVALRWVFVVIRYSSFPFLSLSMLDNFDTVYYLVISEQESMDKNGISILKIFPVILGIWFL